MLAVLLPVILTQGASLRRELDTLRVDVGEVRRDVHALSDRVADQARIVAALEGVRCLVAFSPAELRATDPRSTPGCRTSGGTAPCCARARVPDGRRIRPSADR